MRLSQHVRNQSACRCPVSVTRLPAGQNHQEAIRSAVRIDRGRDDLHDVSRLFSRPVLTSKYKKTPAGDLFSSGDFILSHQTAAVCRSARSQASATT